MTALIIIALVLATTVMLFPVAFVWYINIGGAVAAFKEAQEKRTGEHVATVKA